MNGLPSSIACGLTASTQIQGRTVSVSSDPSNSTDGQGGAYVGPPTAMPFESLDPTGYVCLSHDTDPPLCLPPGTYQKQSGLGFEVKSVDALPPARWVKSWNALGGRAPALRIPDVRETPILDMAAIDNNLDGKAGFNITGPKDGPDPVCSLFSGTQFSGKVWCVGGGGGDILPQWKDVAQSVSCHNSGDVWLYEQSYGDTGGAFLQGNVEDLSNEPYGNCQRTISGSVKALWVLKGQ